MKNNLLRAAAFGAIALLGLADAAHAQYNFFTQDTTINYAVSGAAIVGYPSQNDVSNQTNGSSPTIDLVPGGSVNPGTTTIYNQSHFNVSGGSLGTIEAFDSSAISITSGTAGTVFTHGSSSASVTGGSLSAAQAVDSSSINITGGSILGVSAGGSGVVNVYGGGLNAPGSIADNGLINFFGSNLVISSFSSGRGFDTYTISGMLDDGSVLSNLQFDVSQLGTAHFTLNNRPAATPEPGSVALLVGMGSVGVSILRKRRSK